MNINDILQNDQHNKKVGESPQTAQCETTLFCNAAWSLDRVRIVLEPLGAQQRYFVHLGGFPKGGFVRGEISITGTVRTPVAILNFAPILSEHL